MSKDPLNIETDESTSEEVGERVELGSGLVKTSLKFDWLPEEQETIDTIKAIADQLVRREFRDADALIQTLLAKTRTAEMDGDGNVLMSETGAPVWKRNPDGSVIEDWSRITLSDMDSAILKLATFSYFASQKSIDAYSEAVVAKLVAEDVLSDNLASIMKGTIQDKAASAQKKSREERYFATLKAVVYRRVKEAVEGLDSMRRSYEFIRRMKGDDLNREQRTSGRS